MRIRRRSSRLIVDSVCAKDERIIIDASQRKHATIPTRVAYSPRGCGVLNDFSRDNVLCQVNGSSREYMEAICTLLGRVLGSLLSWFPRFNFAMRLLLSCLLCRIFFDHAALFVCLFIPKNPVSRCASQHLGTLSFTYTRKRMWRLCGCSFTLDWQRFALSRLHIAFECVKFLGWRCITRREILAHSHHVAAF